jgi:hypothetical protein
MCERTSLGKQFESEDYINTAVTASLQRLSKDKYRAAAADGKSVWTVLVTTLSGEHMCKHSGTLVVLLSCILLSQ